MTVQEIIDFLSHYDGAAVVTMVQCKDDNPMSDDLMINNIVSIHDRHGNVQIVIIPE